MKQKILTVLSVLFGLLLLNGGLNKFFNYMPVPEDMAEEMVKDFGAIMEISWLMPLIAIAEIIGGLLIIFPKTRALGAVVIFPDRKSTRLNSSHVRISYAVFCLKKKKINIY